MMLLDDYFASIVGAVRLGHRRYDNLHKPIAYILASQVPIAGLALIPLIFGVPPLRPGTLDIDHCFPWTAWPCGDLWNLLPARPSVDRHYKRDRLPLAAVLAAARMDIQTWWRQVWEVDAAFSALLARSGRSSADSEFTRLGRCIHELGVASASVAPRPTSPGVARR